MPKKKGRKKERKEREVGEGSGFQCDPGSPASQSSAPHLPSDLEHLGSVIPDHLIPSLHPPPTASPNDCVFLCDFLIALTTGIFLLICLYTT